MYHFCACVLWEEMSQSLENSSLCGSFGRRRRLNLRGGSALGGFWTGGRKAGASAPQRGSQEVSTALREAWVSAPLSLSLSLSLSLCPAASFRLRAPEDADPLPNPGGDARRAFGEGDQRIPGLRCLTCCFCHVSALSLQLLFITVSSAAKLQSFCSRRSSACASLSVYVRNLLSSISHG